MHRGSGDSSRGCPAGARGAGQRLLVVDDEPGLVAMMAEMLKGLGYEPVGYCDPTAALQALPRTPQRFAAVVTDEVMPGLTGRSCTEALERIVPRPAGAAGDRLRGRVAWLGGPPRPA